MIETPLVSNVLQSFQELTIDVNHKIPLKKSGNILNASAGNLIKHRDSVSSRISLNKIPNGDTPLINTPVKNKVKEEKLERGNTAPTGELLKNPLSSSTSQSYNKSSKNLLGGTEFHSDSISHIKEEPSAGINGLADKLENHSGSSHKLSISLKTKLLSLSKKLKSITNQGEMPKKDFSAKNQSNVKLFKGETAQGLPSASAYDLSFKPEETKKSLDDYYIIRRVGKGGFATVFLVRLKATGRYFALKAIKKQEVVRLKQERQIMNEKNILNELKHHLLIDLYHSFQSPSNLFMVLEFIAGGDLFTQLRKVEEQAKFYIAEVVSILEYLHNQKVVYRDLKPENILLDSTGHIKLADFGFAKKLETTTSSFCGTPDYIAYEIIVSKPYSFGVDWWSLGVLVFELCSGKTPFRADDSEGIYKNIEKCNIQWVELIKGPIKTLVAGLLQPDSTRRLGAKGVKGSDWFSNIDWEKLGKRGLNPPVILPCRTPENMEKEKVTKGGSANYNDILGDSHSFDNKLGDPFKGVFDGF